MSGAWMVAWLLSGFFAGVAIVAHWRAVRAEHQLRLARQWLLTVRPRDDEAASLPLLAMLVAADVRSLQSGHHFRMREVRQ